ncbi:hypothetical protein N2152v2_009741 [Parachlorella kessleri]
MEIHSFGRAPAFCHRVTVQLRSRAVQTGPRRAWRSACSTSRQLAVIAAAEGWQVSEAGDGSSPTSSGRHYSSSNSRSIERDSSSSSGGSRKMPDRSSSQAKVESILANAGLNPAELQREDPTAYSLLTLPLARVLAKVHTDRLTTKAWLLLHPAQLMARICFLACDVGLTADYILAKYGQNTDSLHFNLDGAWQLLAWLQAQQVSNSQLQIASMSNPQLWSVDLGAAQRSKQHVQQRLGVTDVQWVEAFLLQTKVLAARPEVLDGVAAWLEAEPLGFSRAEVAQLWRSNPQLFSSPAATLEHNLQRLLSRCPLSDQQLRSFMRGPCSLLVQSNEVLLAKLDSLLAELPDLEARLDRLLVLGGSALNLDTEVLLSRTACLLQYGFSKEELAKVLIRHPMVLTSSWDSKLQPMLEALEATLGSQHAVVAALSKAPQLLGTALDTIERNFSFLKQLGLTRDEVQRLADRQPVLLTVRLYAAEFQATLHYFDAVLGRTPQQLFVDSPRTLMSGLHRIDYKVSFMEHKGDTHYKASLSWVTFSDEKFCRLYKYSPAEFKAWEAQWLRSERAREYGLDKPRVSGMERAQAARQKAHKAMVAASREQRLAGADSKEPAA